MKVCAAGLVLAAGPPARALSPGDVMVVGYNSTNPDTISFVTWVDLADGASITLADGEYRSGGDGSGEGVGGGTYSGNGTIEWTNSTGSVIPAGTVIVIPDTTSPAANLGSATGGFGLTNAGEQVFLAQGPFVAGGGGTYLDGTLLFGLDYEDGVGWGEPDESDLPGALDVPQGNISFGQIDDREYQGPRSGMTFAEYRAAIMVPENWAAPAGALSATPFQAGEVPHVAQPDRLGPVSTGLLFHAKRLNGALPIIDEAWMLAQGATAGEADDINGPSCIRIPDWVPAADRADPSAEYYLYFAHHSGNFIRMAWAADIGGPWTGYRMHAALPLQDRGVLSLGTDDRINPGNNIEVNGHIASPQVLLDHVHQRFVMYYHGPADHNGTDKGQSTVVATSADGLDFNLPADGGQAGHGTRPVILGESYFRVFSNDGDLFAFSNTGDVWKAPDPLNPFLPPAGYDYSKDYWDRGPNPFVSGTESRGWPVLDLRPRHFAVLKRGPILYSFLTYKVGRPERIMAATFDFDRQPADYNAWRLRFPEQEVLRAATAWEGVQFPPLPSEPGAQKSGVNQLRDPGILEDADGRVYLFYSGQGEDAIGLARLVAAPEITGDTEVVRGQAHTFVVGNDLDVASAVRRIEHSSPVLVDHDAEGAVLPFNYYGNSNYAVIQSQTAGSGARSFQLAHLSAGDRESLAFPDRFYARPGAELRFRSRLGSSTTGQVAAVQVSFDGTHWQTVRIQTGGTPESSFRTVTVDMDGLAGRVFGLRFLYEHDAIRNPDFVAGAGAGQGWFLDDVEGSALEAVQLLDEREFTSNSFTLNDIDTVLAPVLADGTGADDRILLAVGGTHAGESTGFGKPFVIRIRTSYERFLDDHFTDAEQADPSVSGESADPDGDSLANVLEHVFGTDPRQAGGSMVRIGHTPGGPAADPFLVFPWAPTANYTYQLQASIDLQTFEDIPFTESITTNGDLLDVMVRPDSPAGDPGDAAWFRLKIVPR